MTFVLANLVPADPARAALGPGRHRGAGPELPEGNGASISRWSSSTSATWPRWLAATWGTRSWAGRPSARTWPASVPATVELLVPSLILPAIVLGFELGVGSAFYRGP
ncbi:MAG: hypothetical protein M5T61_20925, partial [Acidimicrobiia bacterium]|nr:hypothetical protein [Acidimicrobiia bacterium]